MQHQKALPPVVYRALAADRLSLVVVVAVGQLLVGAFFFLSVSGGQRRTKWLRLKNLQFILNHRTLSHTDDSPYLHKADCIAITFEYQKE